MALTRDTSNDYQLEDGSIVFGEPAGYERNPDFKHVRTGACVIIPKDGKVLLNLRLGSHGSGTYGTPGGGLDRHETLLECGRREVEEETRLKVCNMEHTSFYTYDNFAMREKGLKNWLTNWIRADMEDAEKDPEICEPDKCKEWVWVSEQELRQLYDQKKLFMCLKNLIDGYGYEAIFAEEKKNMAMD